jgi:uncharacterized protein YndB with AHSA1/START domain
MEHHQHAPGTIDPHHPHEGAVVRLERDFAATPAELWQLLTDPAELAAWLCAEVALESHPGGAITLRFANTHTTIRGQITHFAPPNTLEFTWSHDHEPASVVRFALRPSPHGPGTRLTLTHTRCNPAEIGNMAAGWHHHLELLATQLARQPVTWNWTRFHHLHAHYTTPVA